jgi:hypothetical protein
MRSYFVLIIVALLTAATAGAGLAWDGAYTLFNILDTQSPKVAYGRFTQLPLHWVVVQVSQVTSDLAVLRTTFGIVYAAYTLLALAASWWIVRKRQDGAPLFVWAALGIGVGTLPGQICAVCQSTMSVQLFYPILLAVLIRIPRRTIPVIILLAAGIFFSHPMASALFALAGAVAFLIGWRYRDERRRMWLSALAFVGLCAFALLRFILFRSSYEAGELSLQVLKARFYESLAGLPIVALAFACIAGLLILTAPYLARPVLLRGRRLDLAFASLIVAGVLMIVWASDPRRWSQEVDFREWALFISLPFILMAVFDALTTKQSPQLEPSSAVQRGPGIGVFSATDRVRRTHVIQLTGLIFFVVVSIQSLTWLSLTNRLSEELRASPTACVSADSLTWVQGTPLEHWALTAYSLVIQGRSPAKVAMAGNGCSDESFLPGLVVAQFGPGDWNLRDWRQGWFDLRVLSQQLTKAEQVAPSCTFPLTEGWYGIERSEADWHRWTSGKARMRVLVATDTNAVLRGGLVSILQPNEVDILVNGKTIAALKITQAGWQPFGPLPLALGRGENWVEFVSRNPPTQIPGDSRQLAIALKDPRLTLDDGTTICH